MIRNEVLEKHFRAHFDVSPQVIIHAPGRINLIGEHVDYNHGFTMPGTIDKGISFALSKHKTTEGIELISIPSKSIYNSTKSDNPIWSSYVQAVVGELQSAYQVQISFNGVFSSDLPIGAGLSSSAALCCGLIKGISTLFSLEIPPLKIALIAQKVEHTLGINCGLMDQYTVCHGRENQLILMDCVHNTHEYVPFNLKDYELVLINSKINHNLAESAYNNRRANCEKAFGKLTEKYKNIQSFRDVTLSHIEDSADILSRHQVQYVRFVVEEITRVMQVKEFLNEGKVSDIGALLTSSHIGLKELYNVTCNETDLLVDLALSNHKVLGARQVGGGFGGCVIILKEKETSLQHILDSYVDKTNIKTELFPIDIHEGLKSIQSKSQH